MKFSISEFCITDDPVPQEVADKIIKYHIDVMIPIRQKMGCAIWPSEKSGYRPKYYEIKKGRAGTSQHCFYGKGAVDWTCRNKWQLELLLEELKKSDYMRVCYYPNNLFIHCDYKGNEKLSFVCKDGVNWVRNG